MAQRIVIRITPEGAQVYECLHGGMQATQFFHPDDIMAFRSYIVSHRGSNFQLVADLGDESFYGETIPKLGKKDRNLLIQRKVNQQFLSPRYTAIYSLGKRSSPRREEDIVLSGLTQTQTIDKWVNILKVENVCISGIYTPAILGAELAKNYCGTQANGLLVLQAAGSIYQILIVHGNPRFARITPLPASAESWSTICYDEACKTWQYIVNQRWINKNQDLQLWFLLHPTDFTRLYDHICDVKALSTQGPRLDYHLLDLHVCASIYQLSPKSLPCSDALPLLLYQAAFAPPTIQYAGKSDRQISRTKSICKVLYGAATAALCCFLLAALHIHNENQQLQISLTDQYQLQQQLQYSRSELLKANPQPQKALLELQQLQQDIKALQQLSQYPTQPLYQLSKVLDENEAIQLEKLSWHIGNWRSAASPQNSIHSSTSDSTSLTPGQYELSITARLQPINAISSTTEHINIFAAQLQKYSQGEVQLTHYPVLGRDGKSTSDTTRNGSFGLSLKLTLATLT